ncbi:MAG: hypothetical protein ACRD1L_06795, partial [Terriglobales bacterium]
PMTAHPMTHNLPQALMSILLCAMRRTVCLGGSCRFFLRVYSGNTALTKPLVRRARPSVGGYYRGPAAGH